MYECIWKINRKPEGEGFEMTESQKLSSVIIKRIIRNPDNVCLNEKTVQVDNHDVDKAHKIAKKIWKEELK